MCRVVIGTLVVALCAPPLVAQEDRLEQTFERGRELWDRGRYAEALETYLALLRWGEEDRFVARVARATGEPYEVEEVAPDGHSVRFSPDGRLAAFETGDGPAALTHLVAVEGGVRSVASFPGRNFVFSPTGDRGAYLRIDENEELRRVRSEVARLLAQRDRRAAFQLRGTVARAEARAARVVIRNLRTGGDTPVSLEDMLKFELAFGEDGSALYFIGGSHEGEAEGPVIDVYALRGVGAAPVRLTADGAAKTNLAVLPGGEFLVFAVEGRPALYDLRSEEMRVYEGHGPAHAAGSAAVAFLSEDGGETAVSVVRPAVSWDPVVAMRSPLPVRSPALSPDGRRVALQVMPEHDWEIAVVGADGSGERFVTSEIQHDRYPRFLTNTLVLAAKGEGRHLRSYIYDLEASEVTKLFHNNTVRTIAPEYEWAASPDATKVLVVAERDGDTVSPERGVYLVHRDRPVGRDALVTRLEATLAAERQLRATGEAMFHPVRGEVQALVDAVSGERLYDYQASLFEFGSKYITQPGNLRAIEYLGEVLESFGYEPEFQWFEPRPGVRSANVIATLPGTEDPQLIYVVSSHFDSTNRGPGADDNTSGTSVLLETARVFVDHPLPATVKFAFFTGEEAGLLGSRAFVRRAVAAGDHIVGALNNDMLGWANDHRLDNTIRYSNAGIRDVQHAAAFLFSDLITYDAKYYKSTDAHAYYEEYGDIVGGIGSYPVLGNPHYHRATDVLSTINQDLVRETAKTTVASLALLAASPSRVTGLEAQRRGDGAVVARWTPSPEAAIVSYVVSYGPDDDPMRYTMAVVEPRVTLDAPGGAAVLAVRAKNARGLAGWDWARTAVVER